MIVKCSTSILMHQSLVHCEEVPRAANYFLKGLGRVNILAPINKVRLRADLSIFLPPSPEKFTPKKYTEDD